MPGSLDKEGCLTRRPHLLGRVGGRLAMRPWEALLVSPDVRAPWKSES